MSVQARTLAVVLALGGALPASARAGDVPLLHAAIEQMVQHVVFHREVDADVAAYLARQGYTIGRRIAGKNQFVLQVFKSTRAGQPHVVGFRGTVSTKIKTIAADFDPRGIGVTKFSANHEVIEDALKEAAKDGPVIVAGHSLGGAYAQLAACRYPALVKHVVTFHSPGIERSEANKLARYNRENPAILSDHYQEKDDFVSDAGEALTPGVIHVYEVKGEGLDITAWHQSYLLADSEASRGRPTPPTYDKGRKVAFLRDKPSSEKKVTPAEVIRARISDVKKATSKTVEAVKDAGERAVKGVKKLFQK